MKTLNKIFTYWREDLFGKKSVPNYRKNMDKKWEDNALDLGRISAYGKVNKRNKEKEYPYNIEFGDDRTKEEMDKMQKELMECGCLPDCGCKE
jgi:hypothetical protein